MKIPLRVISLGLLLLTGCARNWVMTLDNGSRIGTVGKPKRQEGVFVYKDLNGQTRYQSAGRVREIAPASVASEKKSQFIQ